MSLHLPYLNRLLQLLDEQIWNSVIILYVQKPENSKDVPLGTLIAVMVEEGEDWQNAEMPADVAGDSPTSEAPADPQAVSSTSPATTASQNSG